MVSSLKKMALSWSDAHRQDANEIYKGSHRALILSGYVPLAIANKKKCR